MLNLFHIIILSAVQGACELLPVSSSAHVIVAEKLMGLDPTLPEMTLLLVMLHTGTMLAVIVFFWNSWKVNFFASKKVFWESLKFITVATIATGFVGLLLKVLIEKTLLRGAAHAEIELLFGNLDLIALALAAAGVLIIWAGFVESRSSKSDTGLGLKSAGLIGMVQGICLPFRGFSRSGATISTGLLLGIEKKRLEDFSFALAVILTPPVVAREALRFLKAQHANPVTHTVTLSLGDKVTVCVTGLMPSVIGMVFSFIAGILALRWLSSWLEAGRWYLFGLYCLFAAVMIFFLHCQYFI